jgi:hypothetical protein
MAAKTWSELDACVPRYLLAEATIAGWRQRRRASVAFAP